MEIDMGRERRAAACEIHLGAWTGGFPRGLRIEASTDAATWSEIARLDPEAVEAARRDSKIRLTFAPVDARYLKFTQLGNADTWWSIAEISVPAP